MNRSTVNEALNVFFTVVALLSGALFVMDYVRWGFESDQEATVGILLAASAIAIWIKIRNRNSN